MNPGGALVTVINQRLQTDPTFGQQIRDMHANNVPLLDMVDALGLSAEMSPAVQAIVAGLDPAVVAGIRQAAVAALDQGTTSLPLDCDLSQTQIDQGAPVRVAVLAETGVPTIQVRAQ